MRLSVERGDSGYRPDAMKAKVLLDDVEIRDCVTADEELGEAICYVRDEHGKLTPDLFGEKCLTEVRRGRVEIILPAG